MEELGVEDKLSKINLNKNYEFNYNHSSKCNTSMASLESQESSLYTQTNYNPMQINGRKVLGPPQNWIGPPPSNACELFIKRIPKFYSDYMLVDHFQRFGKIYEFRLMMDFNERNRGYGYIKYTNEEDAARAKEVMSHFFIKPNKLLEIQYSYNKCRLFVGNLPKVLTKDEIEKGFRELFPKLTGVVLQNRIADGDMNRGFAFIDFPSHKDALDVKKLTTPGRIKKWGRDLKIVWANQERYIDPETMMNLSTLFVRNVHLSVNIKDLYNVLSTVVEQKEIKKISKVREFAFIEFHNRSSAQKVLNLLQDTELMGYKLSFEWALPPTDNSAHFLKNVDYDAILRLKCIANLWNFPIIVFGRVFENNNVQYAAITLRSRSKMRVIFIEINTNNLTDIQSRFCEVVVKIIDKCGGFPATNYVVKAVDDAIHIVGHVDLYSATFIKADDIKMNDIYLYLEEIRDLCVSINYLTKYDEKEIICMYENILNMSPFKSGYLKNLKLPINRILGCLTPSYRNKPPLKYNINNTQIIFVLCDSYSLTNYIFSFNNKPILYLVNKYDIPIFMKNLNYSCYQVKYEVDNLMPLHFVQSKHGDLKWNKIYFGINQNLYTENHQHNYNNYSYMNGIQQQQQYLNYF